MVGLYDHLDLGILGLAGDRRYREHRPRHGAFPSNESRQISWVGLGHGQLVCGEIGSLLGRPWRKKENREKIACVRPVSPDGNGDRELLARDRQATALLCRKGTSVLFIPDDPSPLSLNVKPMKVIIDLKYFVVDTTLHIQNARPSPYPTALSDNC